MLSNYLYVLDYRLGHIYEIEVPENIAKTLHTNEDMYAFLYREYKLKKDDIHFMNPQKRQTLIKV